MRPEGRLASPGSACAASRVPRSRRPESEPRRPATLNVWSSRPLLQPPPNWAEEYYVSGPFYFGFSKNISYTKPQMEPYFQNAGLTWTPTFVPWQKTFCSPNSWRGGGAGACSLQGQTSGVPARARGAWPGVGAAPSLDRHRAEPSRLGDSSPANADGRSALKLDLGGSSPDPWVTRALSKS